MPRCLEAGDVTEADRIECRRLIQACGFHLVDYEQNGATWERIVGDGECLVLAVWAKVPYGKPERQEWTLARYNKDGSLDDFAGRLTLAEALLRAATFLVLPLFSPDRS
jgi:hypothetical protein